MFGFRKKPEKPKTERRLVAVRPCYCGSTQFEGSAFADLINCRGCGLLYYIGPFIDNPVAGYRRIKVDEK